MVLKTLLRSWLGIAAIEKAQVAISERLIDEQRLQGEIADALMIVFSGENTHRHYAMWAGYLEDHGGRFEKTLRRVAGEQAKSVAISCVENRVGGEAFIDELVARVRRKQLDA